MTLRPTATAAEVLLDVGLRLMVEEGCREMRVRNEVCKPALVSSILRQPRGKRVSAAARLDIRPCDDEGVQVRAVCVGV